MSTSPKERSFWHEFKSRSSILRIVGRGKSTAITSIEAKCMLGTYRGIPPDSIDFRDPGLLFLQGKTLGTLQLLLQDIDLDDDVVTFLEIGNFKVKRMSESSSLWTPESSVNEELVEKQQQHGEKKLGPLTPLSKYDYEFELSDKDEDEVLEEDLSSRTHRTRLRLDSGISVASSIASRLSNIMVLKLSSRATTESLTPPPSES